MFEYVVQPGDTIQSIARQFRITTGRLVSINPSLFNRAELETGEILHIPSSAQIRPTVEVNGFADPEIVDSPSLQRTLSFLTYISILGHDVMPDGTITGSYNERLILTARGAQVAPLMVISNIVEGQGFSAELAHTILQSIEFQQKLIDSIMELLAAFHYYGVMVDFEYIATEDYLSYANFMRAVTWRLRPLGYMVAMSLRIDVLLQQQQALARVLPRPLYNTVADRFVIRTNEWACMPEVKTAQIDQAQQALDFMASFVSSQRILLDLPNCCYEWEDSQSSTLQFLTLVQAEEIAVRTGARLQIDTQTGASYFTYPGDGGGTHTVWCGSIGDTRAVLSLVEIYNLGGISYRTVDQFPLSSYLTLISLFDIRKLL